MRIRPNELIGDLIDQSISKALQTKRSEEVDLPYESISEYTKVTGKRFRKTRAQTDRGLSREDAFREHLEIVRKELLESLNIDEEIEND